MTVLGTACKHWHGEPTHVSLAPFTRGRPHTCHACPPCLYSLLYMQLWGSAMRQWFARNCEPMMGSDPEFLEKVRAFKPTLVVGDSAFVCFR